MNEQTITPGLDTPLILKNGVVIRNRFLKSAMSEQLGDRNHDPVPGLANAYHRWADGGIGLAVSGNIMIDRRALGEPHNVVLDDQSDLNAFRHWTGAATGNGAHLWAQLNHPGKQIPAFIVKEPVAPSAIPLGRGLEKAFNTPRAMTEDEIRATIQRFADAAGQARDVGFTGVQIRGAHGYLVSQFLSPRHNQRADQWGGSAENRMRFVLEIYHAMRAVVGDSFPIGIKLNSADFMKDGFTEEESIGVVKALADAGIDLIEISGGTYESPSMMGDGHDKRPESTRRREAYFLTYAEKVRAVTDVPLAVTGGFRSAAGMADAITSQATDMVGLARPLALNPDLPNNAMADPAYRFDWQEPTTGMKGLDQAMMLGLVWYEQQIHRMARSQAPKINLSPWRAVWATMRGIGYQAFRKRRA